MMKTFLSLVLTAIIGNSAVAETPRLLLVPVHNSIKPNGYVECDLYLYNDSKRATMVPSLETVSKVYVLHDPTGTRLPRGDSSSLVLTHSAGEHRLKAGKVEHTKITIQLSAEVGDLAEVYVEIGKGPMLRSNSVLLFCPAEEKATAPAPTPKPTVTPQK
jgi:hypothetical protein